MQKHGRIIPFKKEFMSHFNNVFSKNEFNSNSALNIGLSSSPKSASSRFRHASSLSPSAASPPKKPKLEPTDSKAQVVATECLPPSMSFSSSSSAPLASTPSFAITPHTHHSAGRSRSKVAAATADVPQAPPCPYKKAVEKIALKWTDDGITFKEFAIGNEPLRRIELLGQGNSFQCYTIEIPEIRWTDDGITFREFAIESEALKSIALARQPDHSQYFTTETTEGPKVVKLLKITKVLKFFRLFTDSLTSRKQIGKGNAQKLCDERMGLLKKNFEFYKNLGISCALIRNVDTLKTDGYVLQDYVPEKVISWSQDNGDLSNEQTETLQQFLGVLKLAFMHHAQNCWDLYPRNFGLTSKGVTLLDFTDQPLEGMWQMFPNAIRAWANNNPPAQKLIATYLQSCLTAPQLIHVKEHIQTLITTLGWQ